MKTFKWKTIALIADIVVFIAIISLHLIEHFMKIGQPFYGKVIMLDYYLFFLGVPWTFCGITKGFIVKFRVYEKRMIAAFLTGITFFAVWYIIDYAVICRIIEASFTKQFYACFFRSMTPLLHTGYFLIIYMLRAEVPIFIRNIKTIGLKNTIFGEED